MQNATNKKSVSYIAKRPAPSDEMARKLSEALKTASDRLVTSEDKLYDLGVLTMSADQLDDIAQHKAGVVGSIKSWNGVVRDDSLTGREVAGGYKLLWIKTNKGTSEGTLILCGSDPRTYEMLRKGTEKLWLSYGLSAEQVRRLFMIKEKLKYVLAQGLAKVMNDSALKERWLTHPEAYGAFTIEEWRQNNMDLINKMGDVRELTFARLVKALSATTFGKSEKANKGKKWNKSPKRPGAVKHGHKKDTYGTRDVSMINSHGDATEINGNITEPVVAAESVEA
jgi:hypothetical protein